MEAAPRSLGANASLALVGDVVAKGGMFVALLLLARGVAVGEFARLGVAMAAMLIATSALDGGLGVVATRDGANAPELRGALLRSGLVARLPLLAAIAIACLAGGAALGQLALGAAVLATAVANAVQLALFASFRSGQNLVNEAIAKAFCGISYPILCAAALATGHRSAPAALLAMTIGPLATIPLLALAARATGEAGRTLGPGELLRRSAPFGIVALATLLYYRSPMLMMGLLSSHSQTAGYSVAANIAFGILMLPSAFATGLLPRLAAEPDPGTRSATVRRAVVWSTAILVAADIAVGAASWWLVPDLYGRAYRDAVVPLLVLLGTGVAIGIAGILGAALIAMDRRREVIGQVVAALVVNVAAGAVLIPILDATGAAVATLVTEVVSLGILLPAYLRVAREGHGPAALQPRAPREAALVR
jgi:O-antigen/teichoic acid export membrane protein